jgi:glycosyltransferase involved in cell wall biosynthesis
MRAIHQFLPTLGERDAIGNHVRSVQSVLRGMGFASEIIVENKPVASLRKDVTLLADFALRAPEPDTVFLYHASIGSKLSEFLASRDEPLVVYYHNVTPPALFEDWEPHIASELRSGLYDTRQLARIATLGIGVSTFNVRELQAFGYQHTAVVPILLDANMFQGTPDPVLLNKLREQKSRGESHWLFVGRVAPNKAHQDLIKAFAVYRQAFNPNARLHLVGTAASSVYSKALRGLVAELELDDAVVFTASVSAGELAAYYAEADVFTCASEHEGFCVPLVEAMAHGVPIVAYASSAIPETVGDAAILLEHKRPAVFASTVDRVIRDQELRATLIERGRRRVADFAPERVQRQLIEALQLVVPA